MIIKAILFAIALSLMILGLTELVHIIKHQLNKPECRAVTYSVVFLSGDEPEQQLLYAIEQKLWLGDSYADFLVAVDTGLTEQGDKACRYIAEKHSVNYCTLNQLIKEFSEYSPLEID